MVQFFPKIWVLLKYGIARSIETYMLQMSTLYGAVRLILSIANYQFVVERGLTTMSLNAKMEAITFIF